MVEGGSLVRNSESYESLESLKRYINQATGRLYQPKKNYEFLPHVSVATTNIAAEFESTDAATIAISQIGKAEETWVCGAAGNDNLLDGAIVTCIYKNASGTIKSASATIDSTNSTTEVPYVPAITDGYECLKTSSDTATPAGNAIVTGVTGFATPVSNIAAAATSSTAATSAGVGTMYGRSDTDHNDADGAVMHLNYFTPWGDKVENATCTIDTTDGKTEIRVLKTIAAGALQTTVNGTVVAYSASPENAWDIAYTVSTTANDIWFITKLWTNTAPTTNTHEFIITDSNRGAADGTGGDIYAIIVELEYNSVQTRLRVPAGFTGWVGSFKVNCQPTNAIADNYTIVMYYTAKGDTVRSVLQWQIAGCVQYEPCIELEPETDVYFTILDAAATTNATLCCHYLLSKEV